MCDPSNLLRPRAHVAVIGAGIAGLTAARALTDADLRVTIFEKSRGLGGRLATRRPFGRDDPLGLDHGAPYAEPPSVGEPAPGWADLGVDWDAAPAAARLGAPGMSDLVKPLADGLRIHRGLEIREIAERAGPEPDWLLIDATDAPHGPFDAVISAVPAPQAARLLGDACPEAASAEMSPIWTLLLVPETPLAARADPIFRPNGGPFELIIHNAAKPGRDPRRDAWIAHARPDWSAPRIDEEKEAMAPLLLAALAETLGVAIADPAYLAAHRWRYARTAAPTGAAFRLSEDGRLGVCGDWRLGPTAGDAHRSGALLGAAMAKRLTAARA